MIRKIVLCGMAAVMAAAALAGCGGGGSDASLPIIVADLSKQPISQTHTTAKAAIGKQTFTIENNPTVSYEATIFASILSDKGFKYGEDKIQYPTGTNQPTALFSEVNNTIDGKADLTWTANGKVVVIHLTDLDAVSEAALQSSAPDAAKNIYEAY